MPIVSASRDSKVVDEGVDEGRDQEGVYDSCMESDDSCMDDECVLSSSDESPSSCVHVLGVHTSAHARSIPEVTNPIKLGSSSVITNRNNLLVY